MLRHDYYGPAPAASYKVAILVAEIRKDEIKKAYIDTSGLSEDDFLILSIHTRPGKKKKTPAAEIKEYFETEIIPVLDQFGITTLLVSDADYFKVLAKQSSAEPHLGYSMPCYAGMWNVFYTPSYRTLFYDPAKIGAKIQLAIDGVTTKIQGTYKDPGEDVIKFAAYPRGPDEIREWLQKLLDMECDLACDIEAYSLKHYSAGIGTISFAWNSGEGIAFLVDMQEDQSRGFNTEVREMLKQFFIELHSRGHHIKWHNIGYDASVLIYQLFMTDILDTEGLYEGLFFMASTWDCTKLITYLATNSCAGNELGLKAQTRAFSGNYAKDDIKDISLIPWADLLVYNLTDSLGTWYTYDTRWPTVVADQQEDIYRNIFQPAMRDILHMQLVGMPINMDRTIEVQGILQAAEDDALNRLHGSMAVQEFVYEAQHTWVRKRNSELKVKRVTVADVGDKADFNPNSPDQVAKLLFQQLLLPILDFTANGAAATGGKILTALKSHTSDTKTLEVLDALIDYKAVNKILTAFIPAMLNAQQGKDGWHYLYGNFNLGGTVSGRLSSSDPNMQNLPASSLYAKLIKSCFEAPPGWLFCGLDYESLEDKISALTTKDPNKLKVYTDGYDGHSLRAYSYFGEQMPDIQKEIKTFQDAGAVYKLTIDDVTEFITDTDPRAQPGSNLPIELVPAAEAEVFTINSIGKRYKSFRQDSKAPTFALTYQGTWSTLIKNCGFSEAVARTIEDRYHVLYEASDKWVAKQLEAATKVGYITAAFGLRIRTPMLHQVFLGTRRTPSSAAAEGRTAGNALGQSWCLLNNRACSEFMDIVRSGDYWQDIRPTAHIHDAQYYLIREDAAVLAYANKHLVKAVQWQNHPLIQHSEVKLGGELSIFYPTWVDEITLPNSAVTADDVIKVVDRAIQKRNEASA